MTEVEFALSASRSSTDSALASSNLRPSMTFAPALAHFESETSVGPFGLGAAKDALCKYEFKLKKEVDYSVFSGPSMRIGIDFANVDAAESILPTGQSGNPFSPHYQNQAPLYHSGLFRPMRMDPDDIVAHASATATVKP